MNLPLTQSALAPGSPHDWTPKAGEKRINLEILFNDTSFSIRITHIYQTAKFEDYRSFLDLPCMPILHKLLPILCYALDLLGDNP